MPSIFEIVPAKDREQPQIDNTKQYNEYDWMTVSDILHKNASKQRYVPPTLSVEHATPTLWDYYYEPGEGGEIVSARLKDIIQPMSQHFFSFLPVYINGHQFYFFVGEDYLDCLDREKSDILWSPSDPNKVLVVRRFAFRNGILEDPLVFRIPEFNSRTFCTEGVKGAVEARQCRGIAFTPVAPLG
jgi:hypothetical protein